MPLDRTVQVEHPAHCVRVPKDEKIYIQYVKRAYRFKKIMLELGKARLIIAPKYPTGFKLMNPPTKVQKEILSSGCCTLPGPGL